MAGPLLAEDDHTDRFILGNIVERIGHEFLLPRVERKP